MFEVLNSQQMQKADKTTIENGIDGYQLMENAGSGTADIIIDRYEPCNILVICGPGNNGGDGFIIARLLKQAGFNITVGLFGEADELKGDAKSAFENYNGPVEDLDFGLLEDKELVIDALFGTGLARNIEGNLHDFIEKLNSLSLDVVAVDIASGISSNDGSILGTAINADLTVTFARKKIGHLLMPGLSKSGEVIIVDIGIPDEIITLTDSNIRENFPYIWLDRFPIASMSDHKYQRGHAIINGGDINCTGAGKLAATAALRAGSGLATVTCPKSSLNIYATCLTSVMHKQIDKLNDFAKFIDDDRITAILIGPGNGVSDRTKEFVLKALELGKNSVLDADAISVFSENPDELFSAISSSKAKVILTPHEGEFARIFNHQGDKITRAKFAAELSGATILLKGADTAIASPNGQIIIHSSSPPWLATAGSGDVLSGIICGLLAAKMEPFYASAAGAYIHSKAAWEAGIGMISEDLLDHIGIAIEKLFN